MHTIAVSFLTASATPSVWTAADDIEHVLATWMRDGQLLIAAFATRSLA